MSDAGKGPAGGGRRWGIVVEDVLIWASILALWPWILRGRWIFTGTWVTVLLWTALAAMAVVAVRRARRIWKGPAGDGAGGSGEKEPHADQ